MFARIATFTIGDASRFAEMNERIREAARPIVESMEGWQGATQMVDHKNGKMLVIHYFDSEDNLNAAESTFENMPEQFSEDLRDQIRQIAGGRQSVERFEVLDETRMTA